MEGKNKKNRPVSWFWRWFLNNQVVTALLVVLLILLIVFLFTKVSYLFAPIWQFLAIVGLPIILAGILKSEKYQGFTVSLGCLFWLLH